MKRLLAIGLFAASTLPLSAKAEQPNSGALPPMGSGRRPGEVSAKPRRLRGLLRLFVTVLAGGALGAAAGYAAMLYMNWFPADQASFYIPASAGGFALILGLVHLFHYDAW